MIDIIPQMLLTEFLLYSLKSSQWSQSTFQSEIQFKKHLSHTHYKNMSNVIKTCWQWECVKYYNIQKLYSLGLVALFQHW